MTSDQPRWLQPLGHGTGLRVAHLQAEPRALGQDGRRLVDQAEGELGAFLATDERQLRLVIADLALQPSHSARGT